MRVNFGEINDFLNSFTFDTKMDKYDDNIYVVDTETGISEVFSLETILTYYSLYLEKINNKKVFIFYGFQRGNKNHFYGYKRNKLNTMEVLNENLPITYITITKGLPELCKKSNVIKMLSFFENDSAETEFIIHSKVFETMQKIPDIESTSFKPIEKDIITIQADIFEIAKYIIEVVIDNIKYLILYHLNFKGE